MNDHGHARDKLAALAAGTLPSKEAAKLEAHVSECSACARELERWQRLLSAVERVPEASLPPAVVARVGARAQAHRHEVLERRWNRLVLLGLAAFGWLFGFVNIVAGMVLAESWLNGSAPEGLWGSVYFTYLALTTLAMLGALPLLWKHRQRLLRNL
jgi:anti-sigma factor RsiW